MESEIKAVWAHFRVKLGDLRALVAAGASSAHLAEMIPMESSIYGWEHGQVDPIPFVPIVNEESVPSMTSTQSKTEICSTVTSAHLPSLIDTAFNDVRACARANTNVTSARCNTIRMIPKSSESVTDAD